MDFRPLLLSDIPVVRPFFQRLNTRTCDFTVGGMFMWRDFFHMELAIEEGALFTRLRGGGGELYYNIPLAGDTAGALAHLVERERGAGRPVKFCTVPENCLPLFTGACRAASVAEQPEFFDYLYAAEDLVQLRGRKYGGARNQISQFTRNADAWEFKRLRRGDEGQVIRFFRETYLPSAAGGAYEQEENEKTLEVLCNLDAYGMMGGALIADGAVAGFSIAERVGDTLFTHIEKADRRLKGSYQMLMNQAAAAFAADGVRYINREEDMGDPGLRASKQSYHPAALLKKYTVEVR